jgi:hypothetical protein
MHAGIVMSSEIFPSSDNPAGRMDVGFLLLAKALREHPEDIGEHTVGLLERATDAHEQRVLRRALSSATSDEHVSEALQRVLGLAHPSPEMQAGLGRLAHVLVEAEVRRLRDEVQERQARIAVLEAGRSRRPG